MQQALWFLAIVFALSGFAFFLMRTVEGANNPDGWPGLPVWMIAVWSPTTAALILASHEGWLMQMLKSTIEIRAVHPLVWFMILAPLPVVLFMKGHAPSGADSGLPSISTLAAMLILNLFLGPLGEEMGWRGYLTPLLESRLHWLPSALVVAVIWFVWHLPLWSVDSPQKAIPVGLFGIHVLAYSLIIAVAQRISGGSLFPAIALHLALNMAANLSLFTLGPDPAEWFRRSLPFYCALAAISCALALLSERQ